MGNTGGGLGGDTKWGMVSEHLQHNDTLAFGTCNLIQIIAFLNCENIVITIKFEWLARTLMVPTF